MLEMADITSTLPGGIKIEIMTEKLKKPYGVENFIDQDGMKTKRKGNGEFRKGFLLLMKE